jgi:hypothetical protein
MKSHPKFTAHGYAVTHERYDYGVSIEGLSYSGEYSKEDLADFTHLCRLADDFVVQDKSLYCWWD